jgi:uncharacterized membrane protein (DUF2068 family)
VVGTGARPLFAIGGAGLPFPASTPPPIATVDGTLALEPPLGEDINVGGGLSVRVGRAYSFVIEPPTKTGCVDGAPAAGWVAGGASANTTTASNAIAHAAATATAAIARTKTFRLLMGHFSWHRRCKLGAKANRACRVGGRFGIVLPAPFHWSRMTASPPLEPNRSNRLLPLIGAFKVVKALVLLAAAYGLHYLRRDDNVEQTLISWVRLIHFDPDSTYMRRLISGATGVSPQRLHHAGIGLFIYGALFGLEGIGLLMRKRWAEYVVIVTTSLLLPLEVFELTHPGRRVVKAIILAANLAILAYLIWNLYRTREHAPKPAEPAPAA